MKGWLFLIAFTAFNTSKNQIFQFAGIVKPANAVHVPLRSTVVPV
jgi:hypothetical protein